MHEKVSVIDLGSLLSVQRSKQSYQYTVHFGARWGEEI
jgi:hypothetical protein